MQIGEDEVLSLQQAGQRIGRSPHTLRRAAERGTLQATKIGKTWLTTAREVDRYARENMGRPGRKSKERSPP